MIDKFTVEVEKHKVDQVGGNTHLFETEVDIEQHHSPDQKFTHNDLYQVQFLQFLADQTTVHTHHVGGIDCIEYEPCEVDQENEDELSSGKHLSRTDVALAEEVEDEESQ